jgi:hypothetical protein
VLQYFASNFTRALVFGFSKQRRSSAAASCKAYLQYSKFKVESLLIARTWDKFGASIHKLQLSLLFFGMIPAGLLPGNLRGAMMVCLIDVFIARLLRLALAFAG